MSDQTNTPESPEDADGGDHAGGASAETQEMIDDETTDENGMPLENPSGG